MEPVFFDIYGFKISLKSDAFTLDEFKIKIDFSHFLVAATNDEHLTVKISKLGNIKFSGIKIGQTSMCEVRQVSYNRRQLVYRSQSTVLAVVNDFSKSKKREIEILAENSLVTDDILYFLINACVGEYIESNGFVRIHALSYRSAEKTGLLYGLPGAGKSTLALNLLKHPSVTVFSDEISVFDLSRKILLPYPIRISTPDSVASIPSSSKFTYFFNTKNLITVEPTQLAASARITDVYCLDQLQNFKISYMILITLGIGLIQMREYLIRPNNIPILSKILLNRLKFCFYIRTYKFQFLKRELPIEEKIKILL